MLFLFLHFQTDNLFDAFKFRRLFVPLEHAGLVRIMSDLFVSLFSGFDPTHGAPQKCGLNTCERSSLWV